MVIDSLDPSEDKSHADKICEHCCVVMSEHGTEHLARDCYPKQLSMLRIKEIFSSHLANYVTNLLKRYRESHRLMALVAQGADASKEYKILTSEVDQFLITQTIEMPPHVKA